MFHKDKGLFRSANILQVLSVELSSSCVFRQKVVVQRVNCSVIFVSTNKTTEPRPQVFSANGALTCNCAALLRHRLINRKEILSNLVNSSWLFNN